MRFASLVQVTVARARRASAEIAAAAPEPRDQFARGAESAAHKIEAHDNKQEQH